MVNVKRRLLIAGLSLLFPLTYYFILNLSAGGRTPLSRAEPAAGLAADLGIDFDQASAGTLRGQVTWEGPIPTVPPIETRPCAIAIEGLQPRQAFENPNAPDIDPQTGAVRNAVVFLRGVPRRRSRPWDLPLVRVEHRDRRLHIVQGPSDSRVGFVRRGERVEMVSREALFHSLHVRGAAFFAVPFPDPDQPLCRTLDKNGVVELSSGAGYYWMHAYLLVDDHPYYARTDAQGRFELTQVPPGRYEAVCWLPNWNEARHERDPDTGLICFLHFQPPVERVREVSVKPGENMALVFTLPETLFSR
jgi:hypothetical protein